MCGTRPGFKPLLPESRVYEPDRRRTLMPMSDRAHYCDAPRYLNSPRPSQLSEPGGVAEERLTVVVENVICVVGTNTPWDGGVSRLLERWMPTQRVNGYDLHYVEAGTGTPVVLVHGSINDYRYFEPQMRPFAEYFHVFSISLRHYWPERWDGTGDDFNIAQHADDVAEFIALLKTERAHLLGHSRGGDVALRAAIRNPKQIDHLVLAEPGAAFETSTTRSSRLIDFKEVREHFAAGNTEDALRAFLSQVGGPGTWDRRPENRKKFAQDNVYTLLGQSRNVGIPYTDDDLKAFKGPTLLVHGAHTQPGFVNIIDVLQRELPSAQKIVIPDAAHGMNWDNTNAFNASVLKFLTTR